MPKKIDNLQKYISRVYPKLEILQDQIGLVEKNVWIIGVKEHTDEYILFVDMDARKSMKIKKNDTIAYWCAKNIIANHKQAFQYAQQVLYEKEQKHVSTE